MIDFTQVMMGPVCTQTLGDYGADVIKIERKGAGDLSRSTFEPVAGADNPIFCSLNRNKRSVALDLRDPTHMAQVKALIAAPTSSSTTSAPASWSAWAWATTIARRSTRASYAVGTGYGETGPYAFKGGQDVLAQAISGVMARRSDASVPVSVYPTALADYSAGMHMVQGILLALLHRARTGQGQKISVSLYNSMLAMQMQEAAMILMADSEVNWAAMPVRRVRHPHGAAGDGGRLQAQSAARHLRGAGNRRPVGRSALLRPDAAVQEQGGAAAIFRERYAGNTREHWLARLEAVDILCSPVRDLREAWSTQTLHNQMLIEGDGEGQRVCASSTTRSRCPARGSACARARPGSGSITRTCCASWRKVRTPRQGGAMSVHLRIENHVATVTLARPDVLNAVDLATEAALQRIWTEIEGRDDVRVVVLTGEGERAFCVGADLKNPTTTGLEYWGAARLAASAASRCARP